MLKQKEFDQIIENFRQNHMNGYEEWFYDNVNCEVNNGIHSDDWCKGVRLHSTAKSYAVIIIEGFTGIAFKVNLDDLRMLN